MRHTVTWGRVADIVDTTRCWTGRSFLHAFTEDNGVGTPSVNVTPDLLATFGRRDCCRQTGRWTPPRTGCTGWMLNMICLPLPTWWNTYLLRHYLYQQLPTPPTYTLGHAAGLRGFWTTALH